MRCAFFSRTLTAIFCLPETCTGLLSTLNSSNSLSLQLTKQNHTTADPSLVSETEYGNRRWPRRHEIKSHCGRASKFASLAQLLIRTKLWSFSQKLQLSSVHYKPICWIRRNVTEQWSAAETRYFPYQMGIVTNEHPTFAYWSSEYAICQCFEELFLFIVIR